MTSASPTAGTQSWFSDYLTGSLPTWASAKVIVEPYLSIFLTYFPGEGRGEGSVFEIHGSQSNVAEGGP